MWSRVWGCNSCSNWRNCWTDIWNVSHWSHSVKVKEKRQTSKMVYYFLDTHLLSCEEHRSRVPLQHHPPTSALTLWSKYFRTDNNTFSRKEVFTILIQYFEKTKNKSEIAYLLVNSKQWIVDGLHPFLQDVYMWCFHMFIAFSLNVCCTCNYNRFS